MATFLDNMFRAFNVELPPNLQTIDQHLDVILPQVRPWSEDLREQKFYLNTRWLEISDSDDFQESILHIFREEGEYLYSVDGEITKGSWEFLSESNTLILDKAGQPELFDLAFLNRDFFIIKKHGDQSRRERAKYHVMAKESSVRGLEWRDVMEKLFNLYRQNSQFVIMTVILVALVVTVLVLSLVLR